jgi:hypothetical protein
MLNRLGLHHVTDLPSYGGVIMAKLGSLYRAGKTSDKAAVVSLIRV